MLSESTERTLFLGNLFATRIGWPVFRDEDGSLRSVAGIAGNIGAAKSFADLRALAGCDDAGH